ncbi:MAG: hypothetical protein ACPG52_05860 [Cognaticolwellia sp.]
MEQMGFIFLGAALSFVAALFIERWKVFRKSRAIALLSIEELEFHKLRLNIAISAVGISEDVTFMQKFPSTIWDAVAPQFLEGANPYLAEPIIHWYATLAILGNQIERYAGPNGIEQTGPDLSKLSNALNLAFESALKQANRYSINEPKRSVSLFK